MRRLFALFATAMILSLPAGLALADHHEAGENPCADNPCGDNPCGDNPCDAEKNPCDEGSD